MLEIEELKDIKNHTTFRLPGQARYFIEIGSKEDLKEAISFLKEKNTPSFILGEGSNTIFPDGVIEAGILFMAIKGFETLNEDDKKARVKIGAGEKWDDIVRQAVLLGLSGIEAMSLIPGLAGATPIQNVGAYGQEIKDTLISVQAFDLQNNSFVEILNKDCGFGYRDSFFKNKDKGRYVITSIVLELKKEKPQIPDYPDVKKYFESRNIASPSLAEIRQAIIEIRQSKLPDPAIMPNVGSFFKNVIVGREQFESLQKQYPDIKFFLVQKYFKISTGWLIEKAGLKGKKFGNLSISDKSALVIINNGQSTFQELKELIDLISNKVYEMFKINLEIEPNIVE